MLRKPEISVGLMYHWPGLKRMLSVLQRAQSQFNSVIDLILIDLMENKIELAIYCLSLKTLTLTLQFYSGLVMIFP